MTEAQNIHGRKWGRGIRPWLLIPKYLVVSLLVGGLFSIAILVIGRQFATSAEQSIYVWILIKAIFHFQVIPAAAISSVFGLLLLLQHPLVFLRMRWLLVKILAVVIVVPSSHYYLSYKVAAVSKQDGFAGIFLVGVLLSLMGFVVIMILGRLKPRLGQGYQQAGAKPEAEGA